MPNETELQALLKIRDLASDQLKRFERNVTSTAASTTARFKALDQATRTLAGNVHVLIGGFVAFATVRSAIRTAAEFEKGLVGVGKTADISGEELTRLGDDIAKLGITMRAVPTQELLSIAQAAGQLGIHGSADILKFTETVGKLSSATVLGGEEAAITLARMLKLTGESVQTVDRLGAAIVALGNSFAANEREIADMGRAIAQATAVFGISSIEALAMATAVAQTGESAEITGTAFSRLLTAIDAAVRQGGAKLQTFAQVAGMTADEFAAAYGRKAFDAVDLFIKGLNRVQQAGGDTTAILQNLEIADLRNIKVLRALIKGYEDFASATVMARVEGEKAQAHNVEFARTQKTLGAAFTALENTWVAVVAQQRDAKDTLIGYIDTVQGAIAILGGLDDVAQNASASSQKLADAIEIAGYAVAVLVSTRVITGLVAFAAALKSVAVASAAVAASPFFVLPATLLAVGGAFVSAASAMGVFGGNADDARQRVSGLDDAIGETGAAARRLAVDFQTALATGNVRGQVDAMVGIAKRVNDELNRLSDTVGKKWRDLPMIRFGALLELAPEAGESELAKGLRKNLVKIYEDLDTPGKSVEMARALAETLIPAEQALPFLKERAEFLSAAVKEAVGKIGSEAAAQGIVGVPDPSAITAAEAAIRKYIATIDAKNAAVQAGTVAGDVLNAQLQLQSKFAELSKDKQNELTVALVKAIQKHHELADAQAAMQGLDALLTGLASEKQRLEELLGVREKLTAAERAAATVATAEALARAAGLPYTKEQVALLKQLAEYVERMRDRSADETAKTLQNAPQTFAEGWRQATESFDTSAERMGILGDQAASGLMNAFNVQFFDPMTGRLRELEDVFRDFALSILNAIQQIISQQLAMSIVSGIGGLLGGGGGLFSHLPGLGGNKDLQRMKSGLGFAHGGFLDKSPRFAQHGYMIDRPTMVGTSGGAPVVGGEAGREVVMPVVQTPSGDYGVKAVSDGGGGETVLQFNYSPTINPAPGNDVRAFEKMTRDSEARMQNWFVRQMGAGGKVRKSVIRGVRFS